jgi:NADH-ubiquinone oxidoreductase chain 6
MMLNIRIIELKDNLWRYAFFGFLFTGLFVSEIFFLIVYDSNFFFVNYLDSNNYINWIDFFYFKFTLNFLGETLYIYYFLIFLLSSFLLFLAMFGAILLTLNQSQLIKRQKIYKQILKNSKNSLIFKRIKYSL